MTAVVQPKNVSNNNFTFSATMITGHDPGHDRHAREGLANSPILRRSETNRTSGITANGNCIDRTTWLNTSSWLVPRSP